MSGRDFNNLIEFPPEPEPREAVEWCMRELHKQGGYGRAADEPEPAKPDPYRALQAWQYVASQLYALGEHVAWGYNECHPASDSIARLRAAIGTSHADCTCHRCTSARDALTALAAVEQEFADVNRRLENAYDELVGPEDI